jgi:hypothetical protein
MRTTQGKGQVADFATRVDTRKNGYLSTRRVRVPG